MSVVRASVIAVMFLVVVAHGHMLLWLAPVVLAVVAVAIAKVHAVSGRRGSGRFAHLLDIVRGAAATPGAVVEFCAWIAGGVAIRVLAAACAGAGLGLQHPVAAALVIVPTLELAGLLPLTPGNIGVTSAAVTLALRGRGVPLAPALGTGIALHAVQTLVGVTFGGVCAISLAPPLPPRVGRVLIASAAAALLIAAVATAVLGAGPELA